MSAEELSKQGRAGPVSLVFLGSPEPAAFILKSLAESGHDVRLVISATDKRRGRGVVTSPTPAKQAALDLGLTVSDRLGDALEVGAELGVVVAYGRIIPMSILDHLDMVNVHFSLLPEWRGAAPVERAILSGQRITGVSLMKVEEGLDSGPVYATAEVPIIPHTDRDFLLRSMVDRASILLLGLLSDGVAGMPEPVAQEGEATYAHRITPEDRHVNWSAPAEMIERIVMIGRAWTTFRDGRLLVWGARAVPGGIGNPGAVSVAPDGSLHVGTGDGTIEVSELQPEGRRRQDAAEWVRGIRPLPGDAFI